MYNWQAVKSGKLAPKGWHIPTRFEWENLVVWLSSNGYNYTGRKFDSINFDLNVVAKAMANSKGWNKSQNRGAIDNSDYKTFQNKSGFMKIQLVNANF